jgi:hypothetical protein
VAISGDISNNTFTFGDGNTDYVQIGNATATSTGGFAFVLIGNIINDTIAFGNGNGDHVAISFNDTVTATGPTNPEAGDFAGGVIDNDNLSFGNGNGDYVKVGGNVTLDAFIPSSSFSIIPPLGINDDTIALGNGNGDFVSVSELNLGLGEAPENGITKDTITLGNGNQDHVTIDSFGELGNNKITLGNGHGDYVQQSAGAFGATLGADNNSIVLGNGSNDAVTLPFDNGNNSVTLGNGNNDVVSIGGAFSQGADTISTGTGANDQINVGFHGNADTFGFAFGTNGTNFTTVTGALTNDLVVVNGGQLGGTPSPLSGATTATTLASYIQSLGTLTPDHTYVGFNNTTANDTFIVTDAAGGQTGAIELVGVAFQHSSITADGLLLA